MISIFFFFFITYYTCRRPSDKNRLEFAFFIDFNNASCTTTTTTYINVKYPFFSMFGRNDKFKANSDIKTVRTCNFISPPFAATPSVVVAGLGRRTFIYCSSKMKSRPKRFLENVEYSFQARYELSTNTYPANGEKKTRKMTAVIPIRF